MSGIEPFLVGTAAAGGTAATAGVIGTAGSVTLGGVLSTAGALSGIIGGAQRTSAEADAAEYNAAIKLAEANAEERRLRRETDRAKGRIRANIGKSGVTTAGTPLLALAETAELGEIDALNVRRSGQIGANLDRSRAKSLRRSIPYNVGASLLTTTGSRLSRNIA